jgi:hypothetical protein
MHVLKHLNERYHNKDPIAHLLSGETDLQSRYLGKNDAKTFSPRR